MTGTQRNGRPVPLTVRLQTPILMVLDSAIVCVSTLLAYWVRFDGVLPPRFMDTMWIVAAAGSIGFVAAFGAARLYHQVWRHVGVDMVLRLLVSVTAVAGALVALDVFIVRTDGGSAVRYAPLGSIVVLGAFVFIGTASLRAFGRFMVYAQALGPAQGKRRVVIAGAGDAGSLLLRDIENQRELGMRVIGFVDDDPGCWGRFVRGTRVLGAIGKLRELVDEGAVDEVLIALPSATRDQRRAVVDLCASIGVRTRIMQPLAVEANSVGLADMRHVRVEDLLGREPVPVDVHAISETVTGQVVAVTGAAGSIGSELCRQLMGLQPAKLVVVDIDESRLYELLLELQRTAADVPELHICDIRDAKKLGRVIAATKPSLVLHAAAYKHVPLMELEPDEAVKANIAGTRNVIAACEAAGVDRFVLISTDKAVRPSSIMGLTKAMAELLTLQAAKRARLHATAVRFGNVLGSRGSVVPLFEEQLARGGPLRVTDAEATRYFMTIPEAARLVLQAQAISAGGEIFVLDMGEPVRILDLAHKMITLSGIDAEIEIIGLRPAEKLHEQLVHADQELLPTGCEKVDRLDSLPLVPPTFPDEVEVLVDLARAGESAAVVVRLRALAHRWFGVTPEPEVADEEFEVPAAG